MAEDRANSRWQCNFSSSSAPGGPSFRLQEYSLMLANRHINELLESLQEETRCSAKPEPAGSTAGSHHNNQVEYLRVKDEIQRRIDGLKRGASATTLGESLSAVVAAAAAGQARVEEQQQRQAAAKRFHNHHQQPQEQQNLRRESNTDSTPAFFIPAGSTKLQQQQQQQQPMDAGRSAVAATAPTTARKPESRLPTTIMKPPESKQLQPTAATGRSEGGSGDPSGDHQHAAKSVADSDKERQPRGSSGGIKQQPPPPPPPAKKTVRYLDSDDSAKRARPPSRQRSQLVATAGGTRPAAGAGSATLEKQQQHRLTATETSAEVQRHHTCPRPRNTYSSEDDEEVEEDQEEDDDDDDDSSAAPATYSASATLSSHEMTSCTDCATDSCDESQVSGRHATSPVAQSAAQRQCCISSQTTIAIRLNGAGSQNQDSTDAATSGVAAAEGPSTGGGSVPASQLAQAKSACTRLPTHSSATTTTVTNSGSNSSSESGDETVAHTNRASSEPPYSRHPQFHLSAALWGSNQEQQEQQAARCIAAESKECQQQQQRPPPLPQASRLPPSRSSTLPQTLLVMPSGAADQATTPQTLTAKLRSRQRYQRQQQHHHHNDQQQQQHHRPQQQLLQQRLRRCRRYRGSTSAGSRARVSLCGATCTNASTQTCAYLPCDSFASRKAKTRSQSLYYLAAVCDPDSFALGAETVGCSWRVNRKRIRDSAASAVVLRHCEAFNSVSVGPPTVSRACATLVAAATSRSRPHSLDELHQIEEQQQQEQQPEQQQATSCTHVAAPAGSSSTARHCPSCTEPVLVLRHHRADCRLHERLSATALLFATDSAGAGRGAMALLTRLTYPEDVHLLPAAAATADAAAGDVSKVAAWSVVPPSLPASAATAAVGRTRIAAAAVRIAARASDSWGRIRDDSDSEEDDDSGDDSDDVSDDDCSSDF